MGLEGVLSVLCTPFHDDGSLDLPSLRRHVEHSLRAGVDGVVCFGLAGELYKLTDPEREEILASVISVVDGAVPVVAGTEHTGIEAAVWRSARAEDAGADALMIYPPTFVKPDAEGVVDYYAEISAATSIPIVVQDAPAWTGVPLPLSLLSAIAKAASGVHYVKVEAPPTAPKLSALAEVGLKGVGGYGALHLAEELHTGIVAIMPGSGLPALYRAIWDASSSGGDPFQLHARALPLLSFQLSSLDVFVAVQKTLLHRSGVIDSLALRRPGSGLTSHQQRWLYELLARCELSEFIT